MAIDREELLGIAHAERQRLGRMIQFAEPDSWEQASADPGTSLVVVPVMALNFRQGRLRALPWPSPQWAQLRQCAPAGPVSAKWAWPS